MLIISIMKNHMEKNIELEMDTGIRIEVLSNQLTTPWLSGRLLLSGMLAGFKSRPGIVA